MHEKKAVHPFFFSPGDVIVFDITPGTVQEFTVTTDPRQRIRKSQKNIQSRCANWLYVYFLLFLVKKHGLNNLFMKLIPNFYVFKPDVGLYDWK